MTDRHRGPFRLLLLVAVLALLVFAGCGDDEEETGGGGGAAETETTAGDENVKGNISLVGIWTGEEQKNFQKVIAAFNEKYPNVKVKYNPAGDNTPTVLSTAIEGGNPPDLATVGQPGLVKQFQAQGALKPLDFAREDIEANFNEDFVKLGEIEGKLYSFLPKAANKSTVWYNVQAFEDAGVEPPETWDDFLAAAETLKASGTPAYSLAGADGWTLTDLFENIYLRTAGPEKYDQLSEHQIKWTDPSVKTALEEMAKIYSDRENIVGGVSGALETDFPTSVSKVFKESPDAAMTIEGDFVPGAVKTKLEPGTGFNVFTFPSINDSGPAVVGGGDSLVMFKDTPAAQAFVKFLATPEAVEPWASAGGFSSPNKNLSPDVYPDDITRQTATALAEAETFRFDMSDLAPAEFGGTPGQGEWKILADFLQKPDDIDGTARKLEAAAARAYK